MATSLPMPAWLLCCSPLLDVAMALLLAFHPGQPSAHGSQGESAKAQALPELLCQTRERPAPPGAPETTRGVPAPVCRSSPAWWFLP